MPEGLASLLLPKSRRLSVSLGPSDFGGDLESCKIAGKKDL